MLCFSLSYMCNKHDVDHASFNKIESLNRTFLISFVQNCFELNFQHKFLLTRREIRNLTYNRVDLKFAFHFIPFQRVWFVSFKFIFFFISNSLLFKRQITENKLQIMFHFRCLRFGLADVARV